MILAKLHHIELLPHPTQHSHIHMYIHTYIHAHIQIDGGHTKHVVITLQDHMLKNVNQVNVDDWLMHLSGAFDLQFSKI